MAKTKPREHNSTRAAADSAIDSAAHAGGHAGASPTRLPGTKRPRLPKPVAAAVEAALSKKASDVVVLDLRKTGGFTDYFVICTGENVRQTAAIVDAVRETLKEGLGERPTLAEGAKTSEWILLDYFNFVVHVFSRECRAFYGLERLWGNATRIEVGSSGLTA